MTAEGDNTGLPLLYAIVMTPLPLTEAASGPGEAYGPSPL